MGNKDQLFNYFDSIKAIEDIKGLLGSAETINLDFKEAKSPTNGFKQEDQKVFAKAVSGFANEEGGIIIWGIEARYDKTTELDEAINLKPIKDPKTFSGKLDSLVPKISNPPLGGVRNEPITDSKTPEEGYIKTFIPEGDIKPYKAYGGVNDFFGRTSNNFYRLDPHHIRRIVLATASPDLSIEYSLKNLTQSPPDYFGLIEFLIVNKGKATATHPFVAISPPDNWVVDQWTDHQWFINRFFDGSNRVSFGGGVNDVLHPDVPRKLTGFRFYLDMSQRPASNTIDFSFDVAAMGFPLATTKVQVVAQDVYEMLDTPGRLILPTNSPGPSFK